MKAKYKGWACKENFCNQKSDFFVLFIFKFRF